MLLGSILGWSVVVVSLLFVGSVVVLPLARLLGIRPRGRLCVATVVVTAATLWYLIPFLVEAVYRIL
jgi:hypothetical protein